MKTRRESFCVLPHQWKEHSPVHGVLSCTTNALSCAVYSEEDTPLIARGKRIISPRRLYRVWLENCVPDKAARSQEISVDNVCQCHRVLNVKNLYCAGVITLGRTWPGLLMIVSLVWNWFHKLDTTFSAIVTTEALETTQLQASRGISISVNHLNDYEESPILKSVILGFFNAIIITLKPKISTVQILSNLAVAILNYCQKQVCDLNFRHQYR